MFSKALSVSVRVLKANTERHTDFPIRDCPGVGHPVGHIRHHAPGPLRRRNGVKVGIGGIWGCGKTAGFLVDGKAEAKAPLEAGRRTLFDRLDRRELGVMLLEATVGCFVVVVRCHGRCSWKTKIRTDERKEQSLYRHFPLSSRKVKTSSSDGRICSPPHQICISSSNEVFFDGSAIYTPLEKCATCLILKIVWTASSNGE